MSPHGRADLPTPTHGLRDATDDHHRHLSGDNFAMQAHCVWTAWEGVAWEFRYRLFFLCASTSPESGPYWGVELWLCHGP